MALCTRYRLYEIAASPPASGSLQRPSRLSRPAPAKTSRPSAHESTGQPIALASSPTRSWKSQNASAIIAAPPARKRSAWRRAFDHDAGRIVFHAASATPASRPSSRFQVG